MAHISETTGKYSQVIAKAALIASGWEVAETETDECYDFVIRDPLTRNWFGAQCKTVQRREDRDGNNLVVHARNGKGEPYPYDDVQFIVAVLCDNGETPRVFMFENLGPNGVPLKEYWRTEDSARKHWVEMSIALDRDFLLDQTRLELVAEQAEQAEVKTKLNPKEDE